MAVKEFSKPTSKNGDIGAVLKWAKCGVSVDVKKPP